MSVMVVRPLRYCTSRYDRNSRWWIFVSVVKCVLVCWWEAIADDGDVGEEFHSIIPRLVLFRDIPVVGRDTEIRARDGGNESQYYGVVVKYKLAMPVITPKSA